MSDDNATEATKNTLPYVLFDIGGTNTRVGVSFDGQTISSTEIFRTPKDFDQGIAAIESVAQKLLLGKPAGGIAGGVAGPLTTDKSGTVNAPHLPGWSGRPLKLELSTRFGCEVHLENDTAMAGLGEAIFGSGKTQKIVAYMTISTGVNGVRVVNGKLETNSLGFEIGHQIIDLDGSMRHADLESLISGAALERRYGESAENITNPAVWEDEARVTAYGINNIIVFWAPDIVVLGGSLMKKMSVERVKMYVKNILKLYPELPIIVKSELGDLGGLWGALHYLNSIKQGVV